MPNWPTRRLKRNWYDGPGRQIIVKFDDLPKFYRAVLDLNNPIQRDYLLFVLFTGLRKTAAANIKWEDVDFTARTIRIRGETMKGGIRFALPLSDYLYDLLVARRSAGDTGFVFPANSKSGHIADPKHPLRLVAKSSAIKVTVHDLRRTYITVAETCDISVYAQKALASHSLGKSDTTGRYITFGSERLREVQQKVTDKFRELCEITEPQGDFGPTSN